MATRRDSREWATQILFQLNLNPTDDMERVFEMFWADREAGGAGLAFAESLVMGVRENKDVIDGTLKKYVKNWGLDRMGAVELSVLRMALFELLFIKEMPPAVIINEAVDLARYFSRRESGKFVNGVLDHVRRDMVEAAQEEAT